MWKRAGEHGMLLALTVLVASCGGGEDEPRIVGPGGEPVSASGSGSTSGGTSGTGPATGSGGVAGSGGGTGAEATGGVGASTDPTGGAGNTATAGTSPAGGGSGGPVMNGSGTLTDQYEAKHVKRDGQDYVIQNNVWGDDGQQTISYVGTTFKIDSVSGTGNTAGAPLSYPSVFIGSNYDRATEGSNLPLLVSQIQSVQTSWTWKSNGAPGDWNVSYDVWFSTSAAGDPEAPSGGYLMVWLHDPAGAQPAGSNQGSATIDGVSYTVWFGNRVVSYVRDQEATSVTFDLNVFIRDAVTKGYLQDSWYLTNVFGGFEIWSGGTGLETTDFYIIVE